MGEIWYRSSMQSWHSLCTDFVQPFAWHEVHCDNLLLPIQPTASHFAGLDETESCVRSTFGCSKLSIVEQRFLCKVFWLQWRRAKKGASACWRVCLSNSCWGYTFFSFLCNFLREKLMEEEGEKKNWDTRECQIRQSFDQSGSFKKNFFSRSRSPKSIDYP